jgi:hypothetical protein
VIGREGIRDRFQIVVKFVADSLVYIIDVIVFKVGSETFYEFFNKE